MRSEEEIKCIRVVEAVEAQEEDELIRVPVGWLDYPKHSPSPKRTLVNFHRGFIMDIDHNRCPNCCRVRGVSLFNPGKDICKYCEVYFQPILLRPYTNKYKQISDKKSINKEWLSFKKEIRLERNALKKRLRIIQKQLFTGSYIKTTRPVKFLKFPDKLKKIDKKIVKMKKSQDKISDWILKYQEKIKRKKILKRNRVEEKLKLITNPTYTDRVQDPVLINYIRQSSKWAYKLTEE